MNRAVPLLLLLFAACGEPPPDQTCTDCSVDTCGYQDALSDEQHVLRFESESGDVEALIVREYVDSGIGHSAIFELKGFALAMDGAVTCYNQNLAYENSHHNWVDRARVMRTDGLLELKIEFQPADPNDYFTEWKWRFKLTGPGFDPIPLEITEGNPNG